jgi:hypothetical protein
MVYSMATDTAPTEPIKYTVKLRPEAFVSLCDTADHEHISRTDVINRAIQVYAVLAKHMAEGKELLLVSPGEEVERMRIIFG